MFTVCADVTPHERCQDNQATNAIQSFLRIIAHKFLQNNSKEICVNGVLMFSMCMSGCAAVLLQWWFSDYSCCSAHVVMLTQAFLSFIRIFVPTISHIVESA